MTVVLSFTGSTAAATTALGTRAVDPVGLTFAAATRGLATVPGSPEPGNDRSNSRRTHASSVHNTGDRAGVSGVLVARGPRPNAVSRLATTRCGAAPTAAGSAIAEEATDSTAFSASTVTLTALSGCVVRVLASW